MCCRGCCCCCLPSPSFSFTLLQHLHVCKVITWNAQEALLNRISVYYTARLLYLAMAKCLKNSLCKRNWMEWKKTVLFRWISKNFDDAIERASKQATKRASMLENCTIPFHMAHHEFELHWKMEVSFTVFQFLTRGMDWDTQRKNVIELLWTFLKKEFWPNKNNDENNNLRKLQFKTFVIKVTKNKWVDIVAMLLSSQGRGRIEQIPNCRRCLCVCVILTFIYLNIGEQEMAYAIYLSKFCTIWSIFCGELLSLTEFCCQIMSFQLGKQFLVSFVW